MTMNKVTTLNQLAQAAKLHLADVRKAFESEDSLQEMEIDEGFESRMAELLEQDGWNEEEALEMAAMFFAISMLPPEEEDTEEDTE